MGARVSKINEIILNEYFYRYISKLFIDERIGIGNFLRTIGVKFVVLRGPMDTTKKDLGEWISVSIYGMIGAPIKGFEHESIGLEIDSI